MPTIKHILGLVAACAMVIASPAARAEQDMIRISRTTTMAFLPVMVMEREKLLEKLAAEQNIPDLKVSFINFSGPSTSIDAMLSGNVDIVAVGPAALITLWAKTKGTPLEVKGIAALGSMPMALSTRNPRVRTIQDLTEADRIAVPSIKVSFNAMLLQMAAAKQWGMENYAKLDPLTIGLGQMDAVAAILSGRSEINSDFATPPFLYIEQADKNVHQVITLKDILGDKGTIATTATTVRFHNNNPKLIGLYRTALAEAMEIIATDKNRAIDGYIGATGDKTTSRDILMRAISDPDVEFTTTPRSMMHYARFMSQTGLNKRMPESLADMFFTLPSGGS